MIAEETRALLRRAQAGDAQAAEQMVEEKHRPHLERGAALFRPRR